MAARPGESSSQDLLEPVDEPFTPMVMFTCTYEAQLSNISRTHADLIRVLEPRGAVKVINCNYGHKAQPGFERFLKRPKPPPPPAERRRGRLAPAAVRQRKPQGDGTCFNSALELTVVPGPEDGPPEAVRALLAANPDKYYAVKAFPTTGLTQVPGVICPGLEDGAFVARLYARFFTAAGVGTDPGRPVEVVAERPIMINYKFRLRRRSGRIVFNLAAIVAHLRAAKAGAPGLRALPFPLREIKNAQDGQNISFKFVTPAKKVRINMFFRGKVNILGAADAESSRAMYGYLGAVVRGRWAEFVGLKPLPDRARRAGQARPAPDLTVAGANRLNDAAMAELLAELAAPQGENGPAEPAEGPAVPALGMEELLALARGFRDEFWGGSDDAPLDQVEREDVEDHEEDALHGGAEGGRRPAPHGSAEARDDVVREDVADDQDE